MLASQSGLRTQDSGLSQEWASGDWRGFPLVFWAGNVLERETFLGQPAMAMGWDLLRTGTPQS